MAEPAIVMLRPDDSARAASLHHAAFDSDGAWSARAIRESLSAATTLALGAEMEARLAGLLIIQRIPPEAEILTVCVHPDMQRRGLAQQLLDHTLTLLGPYGVDRLLLDVAADNAAAISFYEANGFTRDGVRRDYYTRAGGKAVDAVLMSRSLAGQTDKSEA